MRRIRFAFVSAVLFCLSYLAYAVPAKPGKSLYVQPDGSTLTVIVHGDEWFHYVTDVSGNLLEENEKGYLVQSTRALTSLEAESTKARAAKAAAVRMRDEALAKASATGSQKIPVILVQFQDKKFSISNPKEAFERLLMQEGYSDNGATGSVRDYYVDQSRGKYAPQFAVMDTVTLSGRMSSYGEEDTNAAKALYEACQKLDSTVDFSQFDNDGDGKIDMALLYYAGYNEAEGGSSSTIWPHQYYVPYVIEKAQSFDGVKLNRYFCTSELKGTSGTNMCGIGTTCHEFAHSLGLPDFYDTNYNDYGDGSAGATYSYDVMCSGSYNNGSRTPPYMNAEELVMLGWMDSITELSDDGRVTLPSIASSSPVAYKTPATAEGEYFLYESRPGKGWDAPLRGGMLVYHVDKSPSHKVTWNSSASKTRSVTAYNMWAEWESYNAINCSGSHPCFYIVPSGNQSSLNYSGPSYTFPGPSNVTSYVPVDWAESNTGYALSGISFDSSTGTTVFTLSNTNECSVSGVVTDSDGNPLSGVTVSASASGTSSTAAAGRKVRELMRMENGIVRASALQTATTDDSGEYTFSLENSGTYIVEASKTGYVSQSVTVKVSRPVTQNFQLLREGEEAPSDLYTYSDGAEWGHYGSSSTSSWDIMCADLFPSSMVSAYAGKQIKSISFAITGTTDDDGNNTTTGTVHAILDIGSERRVCVEVENPEIETWTTVDVTYLGIKIEEGKDIYAGYALKDWACSYPLIAGTTSSSNLIGYMADYNLKTVSWEAWSGHLFKVKMTIGDYVAPASGYNSIADPKNGTYSVGDTFALTLNEASSDRKPDASGVSWFFDDEPASGSVSLNTSGTHTVTAKFTTAAGNSKTVELEITVK